MNPAASKLLILAEMLALYAAGTLSEPPSGDEGWLPVLFDLSHMRRLIATVVLLVLLTLAADLGFGGPAALFGGLILIGYLASRGNQLGANIQALEGRLGIGGASSPGGAQ